MLLTPDCRHSILHDLRRQNAIDTLVEGFCHPFPQRLIRQVSLIRFFLSHHVTEQFQRVHHRIVIIGDMNLIAMHLRPELRPAAILVLSAQQIFHTFAESLPITRIFRILIKPCQEHHLNVRGIIIGSGVVRFLFVYQQLCLFIAGERTSHINILGPSASHALIEQ